MRSGSTLLLHLLIAHDEILGCGESNGVYRTPSDLHRLAIQAHYDQRELFRRFRYVVDQINHTRLIEDEALLQRPNVKKLFLLRRPEAAVASMVETFEPIYGGWTVERAAEVYLERVATLARYAAELARPESALALSYEALVEDPHATLEAVRRFLGLESRFSGSYELKRFTGRRGDPSPWIKAGKVVRDRDRRQVELPSSLRNRVEAVHREALRVFGARCTLIAGPVIESA